MAGNEENVILSNSVGDMTWATINIPSDLGKVSGDIRIDETNDLKNNLYFELTAIDKVGEEMTYSLQLSLTEIAKNGND